jgi:hypothetical protein
MIIRKEVLPLNTSSLFYGVYSLSQTYFDPTNFRQ